MSAPDEPHYAAVVDAILDGRLVPLLGAGVNQYGRSSKIPFKLGHDLPDGGELAAHLAAKFAYPGTEKPIDLLRVSQYIQVTSGSGPLYDALHQLFDADYQPSPLHELLAALPKVFRSRARTPYQLIVTTNYDDALERAFREVGEEFDLVYYLADRENRGKFLHVPPDGEPRLIHRPNKYSELSLDRRTVILKVHGAIDRLDRDRDSYVITEDHYIDYLTRTDVATLLPVTLRPTLQRSHFLFLGYSMRDWNLRVILHRIWDQQALSYKSWAIQIEPNPIDEEFWRWRGVQIVHTSLEEYVAELLTRISHEAQREEAT
jgi:hypothetical protein